MVSTTDSISVRVVVLSFMPMIAWCSISPSPRGVMARRSFVGQQEFAQIAFRLDMDFGQFLADGGGQLEFEFVRMRHRLHRLPRFEDHLVHELLEPIAAFVADWASLPDSLPLRIEMVAYHTNQQGLPVRKDIVDRLA